MQSARFSEKRADCVARITVTPKKYVIGRARLAQEATQQLSLDVVIRLCRRRKGETDCYKDQSSSGRG